MCGRSREMIVDRCEAGRFSVWKRPQVYVRPQRRFNIGLREQMPADRAYKQPLVHAAAVTVASQSLIQSSGASPTFTSPASSFSANSMSSSSSSSHGQVPSGSIGLMHAADICILCSMPAVHYHVSSQGTQVGLCDFCAAWDEGQDAPAGAGAPDAVMQEAAMQEAEQEALQAAADVVPAAPVVPAAQPQGLPDPQPPIVLNAVNGHFAAYRWQADVQQYELPAEFVQRRRASMLQVCCKQ